MKEPTSPSGQPAPGFEIIQGPENGLFFFRCIDINGKPLLLSKGYQTRSNAESALQTALRLAKQPKNLIRRKDPEGLFFTLVSGNKQEMARSVFVASEKELLNTMGYLRQVVSSEKPIPVKTEEAGETPVWEENKGETPKREIPGNTRRHSFRIDIYQRDEDAAFSGRIVHLLTEESESFQELNGRALAQFIQNHLPEPESRRPGSSQKGAKPLSLTLLSGPTGKPVQSLEAGQPLLYFQLKGFDGELPENSPILVKIAARALDGSVHTSAENTVRLAEGNTALISLPGNYFSTGLYRVQASCMLEGKPGTGKTTGGSCIFQIF